MEPNGWKYKALNLASVSIVRWGVSTYTHVFLDVVVCSGLQYKLYILTACCSPKNFEKKSSLELIFWMSVNFPAWLPFYFEQGLDFLILFLSCNRISQPRHYWHMGLITFWCVLWRWGSVRCRLFSSILSPQDARSTFPPAETAKHVSRGCQEPCKGQNHPQLRTIPYGAPNNSPLQQKIWEHWSLQILNLHQIYNKVPVDHGLTAQNANGLSTGFPLGGVQQDPECVQGQKVFLEAPREEKESQHFWLKDIKPCNGRSVSGNSRAISAPGTTETTVPLL